VADLACQAVISHQILETFPGDCIIAEEDSSELTKEKNASKLNSVVQQVKKYTWSATEDTVCQLLEKPVNETSHRYWAIDPIDGTKGFLRGHQYAVALALVENGQVVVSVLGCPALSVNGTSSPDQTGVLFMAIRGGGAFSARLGSDQYHPIQVSRETDPSKWQCVENVEAGHGFPQLQHRIAKSVGITHDPIKMDGQGKYGLVGRGDAVLYLRLPSPEYVNHREKIWDHAPGSLIVEEAGGCVTDMHGMPLDFRSSWKMENNKGIVVSNLRIHDQVIEALARENN
jgi:3'(2'), 5'-bisphosphate nucleotidase